MAGMDIGKRMMEKWGWTKGQGLGKDKQGMTSCLTLRKNDGSTSQGKIEQATPLKYQGGAATDPNAAVQQAAEASAMSVLQSVGDDLGVAVPVGLVDDGGPAAKRLRTLGTASGALPVGPVYYDVDPREAAAQAQQQAIVVQGGVPMMQPAASSTALAFQPVAPGTNANFGMTRKPRMPRVHQWWVQDDWRWSKGTEALRNFEEVSLPANLISLAKKILGEGSRYPARIRDDTECVVEVTGWQTLLVRPSGTGANVNLAKAMLYEVLHPHAHEIREESLLTPDEMVERAKKVSSVQLLDPDDEITHKMKEGLQRSKHGELNRVGIGAEVEVLAERIVERETGETEQADTKEIHLATPEDSKLVISHGQDIRVATGLTPTVIGTTVKLFGKEKQVTRATQLIQTLVETGAWVAFTESFVIGEDTKKERRERASDGPSEQILLKIPEGPIVKKLEKLLKAMERASQADQIKLTSKAIGGKRTMLVDGNRCVHERVKLMVKELSEKGSSPMLTKSLALVEREQQSQQEAMMAELMGFNEALIEPPVYRPVGPMVKPVGPVNVQSVFSAPAQVNSAMIKPADATGPKKPQAPSQGMRRLPPPKLAAAMAKGVDLYANLAAPENPDDDKLGLGAVAVKEEPNAAQELYAFVQQQGLVAPEVKNEVKHEVKDEPGVKTEPDVKVEPGIEAGVKIEPEVKNEPVDDDDDDEPIVE